MFCQSRARDVEIVLGKKINLPQINSRNNEWSGILGIPFGNSEFDWAWKNVQKVLWNMIKQEISDKNETKNHSNSQNVFYMFILRKKAVTHI